MGTAANASLHPWGASPIGRLLKSGMTYLECCGRSGSIGGKRVAAHGGLRFRIGTFEQLAQATTAARKLRFGEARGALHERRDFLMGVALGVVQPQHAAGDRRKPCKRALQLRGIGSRRWRR